MELWRVQSKSWYLPKLFLHGQNEVFNTQLRFSKIGSYPSKLLLLVAYGGNQIYLESGNFWHFTALAAPIALGNDSSNETRQFGHYITIWRFQHPQTPFFVETARRTQALTSCKRWHTIRTLWRSSHLLWMSYSLETEVSHISE